MPLQIMLKLHRCESINSKVVVSSGTSSLDEERLLGEKYESLIRERTVYLIDKETPAPAGTVLLSYVVAKPFPGLQKPSTSNQHRPENTFVQLVGHRGMLIYMALSRSNTNRRDSRMRTECIKSVISPNRRKYDHGMSNVSSDPEASVLTLLPVVSVCCKTGSVIC